jgi:CBS domain containing-hemolysin-like protein
VDSLVPVLIIIGLLLLNALFVAAEFAIIGAPRAAIEKRAAAGDRVAQSVSRMLHDPRLQDRYIATAQLGITVASLGLGMYGEHILAEWLAGPLERLGTGRWIAAHTLAVILSITLLTYFHIVIGEMVPKSLALQHAEGTVLRVTPLMLLIKTVFYPLVLALNGIGNGILRLFGIRREFGTSQYHTAEELEFVVRESGESGQLPEETCEVIRSLFEFGERTVGEAMVPRVRVTGIPFQTSREALCAILRESKHTRYPVYAQDLDHILGMLHIKDVLRLLRERRPLTATDLRPVPYVPATMPLDEALGVMRQQRAHLVVVMDEHGGTEGVLTVDDVFEEVIGGVEETGSDEPPEVYQDALRRLHVAGTVRLDEVGEALDRVLEHEEVDTVSGLVLARLGRPPLVGDFVVFDGLRFEVAGVEGHGVAECIVTACTEHREGDPASS